jgi:hypothetical protein
VVEMKKMLEASDRNSFFEHMVFMMQVPLVNGSSKERPNKYDEKILQVTKKKIDVHRIQFGQLI